MNMAGIVKSLHTARGQIDTALAALGELFTITNPTSATGIAMATPGTRRTTKAQRRTITPEQRAQMSARSKEIWAAKRRAAQKVARTPTPTAKAA